MLQDHPETLLSLCFWPPITGGGPDDAPPKDTVFRREPPHRDSVSGAERQPGSSAVIHSPPAIQFREGDQERGDQDNMDSAVCLREFGEGEWLRLLPNRAHVFHVACI